MSVPRPAMLVAIVMAPGCPACATISASRWWYLAFKTSCRKPRRLSMRDSVSETSTLTVPTRIGRPRSCCRSTRLEEHTSELQSQSNLVCRLLLEKKKIKHDLRHIARHLMLYSALRLLHHMTVPDIP